MVILGISPTYFLDEMSLDEINSVLTAENEKEKRNLEKLRLNWFHTYRAFGADVKSPEQLVRFEWEKAKGKIGKKLTKEEVERKNKQVQRWLAKHQ